MNAEDITDEDLLDAARLGLDVQEFAKSQGGLALIELAIGDLNDAMLQLLSEPDLMSDRARESHGRARAAYGVISYIKDCIRAGREAERRINEDEGIEHE